MKRKTYSKAVPFPAKHQIAGKLGEKAQKPYGHILPKEAGRASENPILPKQINHEDRMENVICRGHCEVVED